MTNLGVPEVIRDSASVGTTAEQINLSIGFTTGLTIINKTNGKSLFVSFDGVKFFELQGAGAIYDRATAVKQVWVKADSGTTIYDLVAYY